MVLLVPFSGARRHRSSDADCSGKLCRGFTLTELLAVLAVIVLLAALLFPVLARAREQARQAACLSNLRQIAMAHLLYLQDWDERFPSWRQEGPPQVASVRAAPPRANLDAEPPRAGVYWTELLQPYLHDTRVVTDPSAAGPAEPGPGRRLADYALLTWGPDGAGTRENPYFRWPGPTLTLAQVIRPTETFTAMDGYTTPQRVEAWHLIRHGNGMNAAFLDGHVRWLLPDEVKRVDMDARGFCWWHYAAADR
jgi:prepilin-type N-terminal cleavage/methylation domain-containing protein/prepilin-type processing-associated H-X9-DG protein